VRTRLDRFSIISDLSFKRATSKVVNTTQAEDKLTVVRFDAVYSGIDRWFWTATQDAYASISVGIPDFLGSMGPDGDGKSGRRGGSGATTFSAGKYAGGDFTKLNLGYTRIQPTFDLQSLMFRFDMQYSPDLLTSLEQYSLGGPSNVRAYPVAEILVDNAVFTSFEYIFSASPDIKQTWLNKLQFSVFFDFAKGDINDPILNSVSSATLSGLGVGVQVQPFNKLKARIDLAKATGDKPSDTQTLPFYFSLEYKF
jgi:hemolysin activation/secretion protein